MIVLAAMMMVVFASLPGASAKADLDTSLQNDDAWWQETTLDRNQNQIHDMIERGLSEAPYRWIDERGRVGVIVSFDHEISNTDQYLLESETNFETGFQLSAIQAITGTLPATSIHELLDLPGVVFVELEGELSVSMEEVKDAHDVTTVWEETGYTGAGSVVAVIDTGIDSSHIALDDLDDDNATNDPKVIAFYDAINAPDKVNGTDVVAYDDQGHGSHCAGITAGTGAPDKQYVGVAPQAQLVGVKVLDAEGSGSFGVVMAGMQWTVDHRHEFNIRVATMSLGGLGASEWTSSEEDSVNRMANEMVRSGIALFIAAGNSFVNAQIGTPGSAEDVITVGALDKDTSIAIYSSKGPTEEGRIKPNIAFVGSSVMSVEANSGDGYTDMSGTSMATPGAAGVAALMYQANPDISPFDIRNIMQERAEYRPCHYMGSYPPCPEDLVPKNRQNNVYGHGHVWAPPSVIEAANQTYNLNTDIGVNLTSARGADNKVHIGPGDDVAFRIDGSADEVQWRTWDMRDTWMDITEHDPDDSEVIVSHAMLLDRLQELPGVEIEGNHTIMVRSISGDGASPNTVVPLSITGKTPITLESLAASAVGWLVPAALGAFIGGIIVITLMTQGVIKPKEHESLIAELVDSESSKHSLHEDREDGVNDDDACCPGH